VPTLSGPATICRPRPKNPKKPPVKDGPGCTAPPCHPHRPSASRLWLRVILAAPQDLHLAWSSRRRGLGLSLMERGSPRGCSSSRGSSGDLGRPGCGGSRGPRPDRLTLGGITLRSATFLSGRHSDLELTNRCQPGNFGQLKVESEREPSDWLRSTQH
jgi:hypothetical protein